MPVTSNGIYVEERGSGPVTVIMLPGLGCSIDAWSLVTPLLDGYRLVLMDLPGHAGSLHAPADGSSLTTMSAPVGRACDELGLERFVVVGHSLGAALGLRLALDRPDQVVALAAFMPWNAGGAQRDDPFMPQLLASCGDSAALDHLVDLVSLDPSRTTDARRTMKGSVSGEFWRSWYGGGVYTSMVDELPAVRVPVTYVLGGKDAVAPRAELIADVKAMPGGRLVLLPDAGHLAPYEHPELVAAEIRDVLARHTSAT